jgi:hypothetical protein
MISRRADSSNDWKIESAMDAAIMQKLLPKLHGFTSFAEA